MSKVLMETQELQRILGLSDEAVEQLLTAYPAPKGDAICISEKRLAKIVNEKAFNKLVYENACTLDRWIYKHQTPLENPLVTVQEPEQMSLFTEADFKEERQATTRTENENIGASDINLKSLSDVLNFNKLKKQLDKIMPTEGSYEIRENGIVLRYENWQDIITIKKLEKKFVKFEDEDKPYKALARWVDEKLDKLRLDYLLENGEEEEEEEEYESDADDEYEVDDYDEDYDDME